jgi:hypothetical protein
MSVHAHIKPKPTKKPFIPIISSRSDQESGIVPHHDMEGVKKSTQRFLAANSELRIFRFSKRVGNLNSANRVFRKSIVDIPRVAGNKADKLKQAITGCHCPPPGYATRGGSKRHYSAPGGYFLPFSAPVGSF